MKISRIISGGRQLYVIHEGSINLDFQSVFHREITDADFYETLMSMVHGGIHLDHGEGNEVTPESYLLPVPNVGQIRDFYAFEEHVRKAREQRGLTVPPEWYEFPAYYYSGNSSIFPGETKITYPDFSNELDYELEIAAVIGKGGRNIRSQDAWNHILGFTLASDWSARDLQRKEMKIGLGPAKSKDFATSLGKSLTTADEVIRHADQNFHIDCSVSATVNNRLYTKSNVISMHWSFPQLIEWASKGVYLNAGDIIMSGTVPGGCILELGSDKYGWLSKGDRVKFRSEFLGELEAEIV